jgi:methanogenic corrinoid protein MtbC1
MQRCTGPRLQDATVRRSTIEQREPGAATATTETQECRRFLECALLGDLPGSAEVVLGMLDEGTPPLTVLTEVLRPVQHEVGLRWQRGLSSVADEHTASAAVDNALNVLARAPQSPRRRPLGRLAIVVAGGEWHTLPARMAALTYEAQGWEVTFLGASLPPPHARDDWPAGAGFDALGVSCTLARSIPGAMEICARAEAAGIPTVVGGAAYGADATAARALGLRWTREGEPLSAALARPLPDVDAAALACRSAQAQLLWGRRDRVGAECEATVRDLQHLVDTLAVSTLTGDLRLAGSFARWLAEVLAVRAVPSGVLTATLDGLAEGLPAEASLALKACEAARDGCHLPSTV